MRKYAIPKSNDKILTSRQEGWIRGLDVLVSASQIKPNELSEAIDIQLVEDGKIQCPRDGQAYYGSSSGSRVTGLFPFYKSDGTKQLLRMSGTALQKFNTSTLGWDDVSGFTYTTTLNANGVMAYDKLYICNGTDALTYYDGTSITSFTAINPPNAPTVTRTGTTGSYTYSYKITAVSAVGETTASAEGHSDLNVATLDTNSYMSLSWAAVTSAIGYNVYGRKNGNWKFITYLEGNGSTSYIDKGTVTPSEAFPPPDGNTTDGPKGKYINLYKDTLFVFGDPSNPSRLYYSGGGDKVNDFTVGGGGGFIDIAKNDGQLGTGLYVFKNTNVVFKQRSIYQFSFDTSGLPQVVQVNPAVGAIAPRSIIAVENDLMFMSERGWFTVGNEQGFAFDVLRTNEISARVRSIIQAISPAYISNVAAVYATVANKNLVIISYTPSGSTTNTKALVFDRERNAWYKWNNIQANCWATFIDATGNQHVLYGDDASGYVKEVLTGSDDFGAAIAGSFKLKADPFDFIGYYKTLKDVSLILRNPTGAVNLSIVVDGTTTAFQTNINTVSPSINFAHYLFNRFLFGSSYGTGAITSTNDLVERTKKNLNLEGKVFQLCLDNGSSGASFTLLATEITGKPRSARYRHSTDIIG